MEDKIQIKLSEASLSLAEAMAFVEDESCGAVSFFVGTVRNHNRDREVTHLFFESYEPMAVKELMAIAKGQFQERPVHKVYISHRLGNATLKEMVVLIAVSAAHRAASIRACEEIIDQLKERVPIWKKEYYANGSHWINSRP